MFATVVDTALNAVTLLGLLLGALFFAPRAWRASEAKAREQEMQRTIEAYKGRVEALEPAVEALHQEVADCQSIAAKWEARYHEQSQYTAKDALTSVLHEMSDTRTLIHTSMEGFSDLVMEHSKLVAAALDRLEGKPPE